MSNDYDEPSAGDEPFPSFREYRRCQRQLDDQVNQAMAAVHVRPGQSAAEVRAAFERELEQRGVTGLPPERIDVTVQVLLAGSRRFGRLRLIPTAIGAVFGLLHAFYELLFGGESEPRWLRSPHGDWGRGPSIDRRLQVRVSQDADALCRRIADEAFQEDDGRRQFHVWLTHDTAERVIVHAGKEILGELSPEDATEIADDVRAMQNIGIHLYAWATMKVTEQSSGDTNYTITIRANHINKRNIA